MRSYLGGGRKATREFVFNFYGGRCIMKLQVNVQLFKCSFVVTTSLI